MGCRGNPVPGQSLGGAAAAIVSTYSSRASEAAQISDGGPSTTAHLSIHLRVHMGLTSPVELFHKRVEVAEARDSDWQ